MFMAGFLLELNALHVAYFLRVLRAFSIHIYTRFYQTRRFLFTLKTLLSFFACLILFYLTRRFHLRFRVSYAPAFAVYV